MNKEQKPKIAFLPIFLSIVILTMSLGYAAMNVITNEISGNITAVKQTGIFITDVEYYSNNNAEPEVSTINNYIGSTLDSSIVLSPENDDSTITYKITMYNSTEDEYKFNAVLYGSEFYDNDDIYFTLTDLSKNDRLISNGYITFYITFAYKNGATDVNNTLNSYLNFDFIKLNPGAKNLKVEYELSNAWNDGTAQFYLAEFTVTNIGTADVDGWAIDIPFSEEYKFTTGWSSSGYTIEFVDSPDNLNISSPDTLTPGAFALFSIQFGVQNEGFDFEDIFVSTDGEDPGGETPGGGEEPGGETPGGGEEPGGETPGGGEEPGGETPGGGEEPGGETPGGGEEPGGETPGGGEEPPTPTFITTAGIEVEFEQMASWGGSDNGYFYQYNLKVTNITEEVITDWQIVLGNATFLEVQAWNLSIESYDEYAIIQAPAYNNSINPGASYSEGGFIISITTSGYEPTLQR